MRFRLGKKQKDDTTVPTSGETGKNTKRAQVLKKFISTAPPPKIEHNDLKGDYVGPRVDDTGARGSKMNYVDADYVEPTVDDSRARRSVPTKDIRMDGKDEQVCPRNRPPLSHPSRPTPYQQATEKRTKAKEERALSPASNRSSIRSKSPQPQRSRGRSASPVVKSRSSCSVDSRPASPRSKHARSVSPSDTSRNQSVSSRSTLSCLEGERPDSPSGQSRPRSVASPPKRSHRGIDRSVSPLDRSPSPTDRSSLKKSHRRRERSLSPADRSPSPAGRSPSPTDRSRNHSISSRTRKSRQERERSESPVNRSRTRSVSSRSKMSRQTSKRSDSPADRSHSRSLVSPSKASQQEETRSVSPAERSHSPSRKSRASSVSSSSRRSCRTRERSTSPSYRSRSGKSRSRSVTSRSRVSHKQRDRASSPSDRSLSPPGRSRSRSVTSRSRKYRAEGGHPKSSSERSRSQSGRSRSQSGRSRSQSGRSRSQSGRSRSQSGRSRSQSGRSRSRSVTSRSRHPNSYSERSRSQSGRSRSRSVTSRSRMSRRERQYADSPSHRSHERSAESPSKISRRSRSHHLERRDDALFDGNTSSNSTISTHEPSILKRAASARQRSATTRTVVKEIFGGTHSEAPTMLVEETRDPPEMPLYEERALTIFQSSQGYNVTENDEKILALIHQIQQEIDCGLINEERVQELFGINLVDLASQIKKGNVHTNVSSPCVNERELKEFLDSQQAGRQNSGHNPLPDVQLDPTNTAGGNSERQLAVQQRALKNSRRAVVDVEPCHNDGHPHKGTEEPHVNEGYPHDDDREVSTGYDKSYNDNRDSHQSRKASEATEATSSQKKLDALSDIIVSLCQLLALKLSFGCGVGCCGGDETKQDNDDEDNEETEQFQDEHYNEPMNGFGRREVPHVPYGNVHDDPNLHSPGHLNGGTMGNPHSNYQWHHKQDCLQGGTHYENHSAQQNECYNGRSHGQMSGHLNPGNDHSHAKPTVRDILFDDINGGAQFQAHGPQHQNEYSQNNTFAPPQHGSAYGQSPSNAYGHPNEYSNQQSYGQRPSAGFY